MTPLYGPVHRLLRDGLCRSLCEMRQLCEEEAPPPPGAVLAQLQRLLRASEGMIVAERDALAAIRGPLDSSFASPDLLGAARRLQALVGQCERAPPEGQAAEGLYRYYALFVGEMLVQMHAKEAEVEPDLVRNMPAASLRLLREQLEEVAGTIASAPAAQAKRTTGGCLIAAGVRNRKARAGPATAGP